MKSPLLAAVCLIALGACTVETLETYQPVTATAVSQNDLAECRAIATAAEADYRKRQNDALVGNLIVGVLVGAAVGNAVGGNSDWTAYGAATGAAQGVAATDTELAHGGPRRIMDRCLANRGHTILSDLGRG